jgi:hypothetical protein
MGKELNVRDKKTIKGILEGKSTRRAMIDAGFSENTANAKSGEKLERLAPTITKILEKQGITDDLLAKTLLNSLKANKYDLADHPIRLKAGELALKIKGYLKDNTEINNNIVLEVVKFG